MAPVTLSLQYRVARGTGSYNFLIQHRGRIGLELYYTGTQPLDDNPYRSESKSYFEIGLLGEIVLGRYRLFLNLENLLNVRQTRE